MGLFLCLSAAAAMAVCPAPSTAQTPEDTVPAADTVPEPADTLPPDTAAPAATPPDTAAGDTLPPGAERPDTLPPDSLAPAPFPSDTVVTDTTAVADTVPPLERMPPLPGGAPPGWERGVWTWDRDALLGSRATTLDQLLAEIPGVIQLRGGDVGMPRTVGAFGAGGGGVRVFRDGVELLPLEGSVTDLSRVALTGVDEVRVERSGAGLRVELHTIRTDDPRPYSLVEAGTGDLDTNLLRGVFFHPRAMGGNVGLALERNDTRGPGLREPGSATSVWAHYAYLSGDRFGVAADLSRSITERDTLFVPGQVTRTDWRLRGRWQPVDGVVADLYWGRASLEADSVDGRLERFPFRVGSRGQWGAALGVERGPLSGRVGFRDPRGEGLPERELEAELIGRLPGIAGAGLRWRRGRWSERATTTLGVRAWTEPRWGLSAFASVEDFERGVPALPPSPDDAPDGGDAPGGEEPPDGTSAPPDGADPRFTAGRSARLGGRFAWRGLEVAGARLVVDRDSVHPLGLPMDRSGLSLPAGERSGWELSVRLPLLLVDGLALEGSGQLWDEAADPRPYFPRRTWDAALRLHETYFPTGNLEVWFDLGVQGRDRMAVSLPAAAEPPEPGEPAPAPMPAVRPEPWGGAFASWAAEATGGHGTLGSSAGGLQPPDPAVVPFYQSFYVRLQIRVVTVRVFAQWENFTLRAENQDFPGRVLPTTRATYGVRWTLWN